MPNHILLYTDDPGTGGVAQYNHALLLALIQRGDRVTSVQSRAANPLIEQQQQAGIHHEWLGFDTTQEFGRTFTNRDDAQTIFTNAQPDLIIFSDACPVSNFAAKQVAASLNIPYVVVLGFVSADLGRHFAADIDVEPFLQRLATLYTQAQEVIAVSQENLQVLRHVYRSPAHRGRVIYYGRPEPYFGPRREAVRDRLRAQLGIPTEAVVCLTAARLEPVKGYGYQLEAIAQLKQTPTWNQLYFVWVGDGSLRDEINQALETLQVSDRVKLVGQQWNMPDWYDMADIFILPSEVEGMPLAIMEAMAKGIPVMAAAVSGIPEELGDTGALLPDPNTDPTETVHHLLTTLEDWVTNPSKRQAIAQASQQRARALFTEARMLRDTLAVIDSALTPTMRSSLAAIAPSPTLQRLMSKYPTAAKHILLYTDDFGMGGVAQYNHSLALGMRQQGYQVTLVQSRTSNPLIEEQQQQGVQHEWLEYDTRREFNRTFSNLEDAREIFTRVQPDLIIFSDGWPMANFAAKQVAIQQSIPYIVVVAFAAPYLAEKFAFCLEGVARQYAEAKAVVAVSQHNLQLLHMLFRLPEDKGEVIHYGRPDPYFYPPNRETRDRLRQEVGIPNDAILCLTMARLEGIKGYLHLLEAIAALKETPLWPQLYFVWLGEGDLRSQITERLQHLKVGEQVKLLGHRWDGVDWYDVADLFVFPSEFEGMPLAVMEAMAKGLPVVASAISGIPEELGNTGRLLTDPRQNAQATVQELVETIHAWATNSHVRQKISEAAKLRAEMMFREERMVRETIAVIERSLLPKGDYVSPGLAMVQPDVAFPNKVAGNPYACSWEHLRRHIPHNWYVDRRHPTVGFLSRDEAHILYNTALQFRGKRALEVGCWLGWSACHLALAGVELDVVDPLLDQAPVRESVVVSLEAAGVLDTVQLVAGYSPQAVIDLANRQQRTWSLIFIDGNHEAPGPLEDAIACAQFAEPDALIVFHDLAAPDVAQGLDYLQAQGWHTLVYQTMQIMGVAWRGQVQPIFHQPDPQINWELPDHLRHHPVSGKSPLGYSQGLGSQAAVSVESPEPANPVLERLLEAIAQLPPLEIYSLAPDLEHDQILEGLHEGKTAWLSGNLERAATLFGQVVQFNPGSVVAHRYLSLIYWHQGDLQRSLWHYRAAHSGHLMAALIEEEEFQVWKTAIAPYTLLSDERLFSLYALAKQICLDDIPGHFVECGTYKGGSAALLAAVIQRYSRRPRLVYAFDTFSGMPDPTEADRRHRGIPANDTPWGAGTLQAPIAENLQVICAQLGVQDLVIPVAGLFAQTLPQSKETIGAIAFLHADGDWYESTLDIFNNLYAQVVPDGVIQVDDYGHWEGCRQAIHEFERQQQAAFTLRWIDITGAWFRKRDPADPECNYGQTLWHLTQMAARLGDVSLAFKGAKAVLHLIPQYLAVEQFLEQLQTSQSTKTASESRASLVTDNLERQSVNVVIFPDWQQSEEVLFADFVALLRTVLGHQQVMTLWVEMSGADPEAADALMASAVMHLLTEENLDVSEAEPHITLFSLADSQAWQTLRSHLTARIVMEHENREAIALAHLPHLPTYTAAELMATPLL
jgi:glycosyltransferase involved in cell wall biosynthesis/predicted O-methyltransferase YrrM